jgi:hypothetical protein
VPRLASPTLLRRRRHGYFKRTSDNHSPGRGGAGSEPSEAQMKDAMLEAMNHPSGEKVSDPIKILFFKKEACDDPTRQGFRCTLTVKVGSGKSWSQLLQLRHFRVLL